VNEEAPDHWGLSRQKKERKERKKERKKESMIGMTLIHTFIPFFCKLLVYSVTLLTTNPPKRHVVNNKSVTTLP